MSVTAARRMLPTKPFQSVGDHFSYCSDAHGNTCTGIWLEVRGQCDFEPCAPGDPDPVVEMDITAPIRPTDPRRVETSAGIALRDPAAAVRRRYSVVATGEVTCGALAPPPGETLVAVVMPNTLAVSVHRDKVFGFALVRGRHRNLCSAGL